LQPEACLAFYQKYRAKTFAEMVGQEHVVLTILQSIKSNRLVHAYLLTGPRGIGKTSTARLLSKAINCHENVAAKKAGKEMPGEPCNKCDSCLEIAEGRSLDVLEMDAASHTGVDEIREVIESARLMPAKSDRKIFIIDEVHMLSKSAFNALLKTLEEPPSHVVFIMATTESHKVPATILSRAQRFDFKRASKEELIANLKKIAKAEKIEIDDEALDLIAVSARGGHRDAISLFEQVAVTKGPISLDIAREVLGIAKDEEVFKFVGAIFNESPEEGLKIAHGLFETGHDLADFNQGVIELLRRILLLQITGRPLFEETESRKKEIAALAAQSQSDRTILLIKNFIDAAALLKDVNYPLLPIEIAVIKSCGSALKAKSLKLKAENEAVEVKSEKLKAEGSPQGIGDRLSGEPVDRSNSKPASEAPSQPVDQSTDQPINQPTSVPVPVVDMTRDIWQQVVDETKKQNSTLAALLRDAKPEEVTKDTLTLGVKFKFHKDKISETKNLTILEKIVCDVTGCSYKVFCKISEKPKPAVAKTEPAELEKAVGEVFEIE
jgi:DNA polymerase-3 subunit gamma/tau